MTDTWALFDGHTGGADVDGVYRYHLWREWAPTLGRCCFVMLNPSTADGSSDDATIRRCIRFATDWGYGRLDVVNLYALRATDPRELWHADDPVGPRNYLALGGRSLEATLVVLAWGVNARASRVAAALRELSPIRDLHVLGLTKEGAPRHPLYVRATTRPQLWRKGSAQTAPIHVLHEGLPLCGFTRVVPRDWPAGHLWVGVGLVREATCSECRDAVLP